MEMQTVRAVTAVDKGYTVGAHGLVIERPLTLDEWLTLGRSLQATANRIQWAIGDWLAYGAGRGEYGATYEHAALVTGRSYEALGQYQRVSQAFQVEERAVPVSWSFYREALRLPACERLRTLEIAANNKWTRDDVANYIASRGNAEASPQRNAAEMMVRRVPHRTWKRRPKHHRIIGCPQCGHRFEFTAALPEIGQRVTSKPPASRSGHAGNSYEAEGHATTAEPAEGEAQYTPIG